MQTTSGAKKNNYSDVIYGFDIETTTTEHITSHYLSSFISVNFNTRYDSTNDILQAMSVPLFCRSNDDVNDFLIKLNNAAEADNITYIIYSHNLAYEWDYLIKNIDFVKKNFDNKNALFIKPRIPLYFKCKNIEFRCSYRFLNQSLKALGQTLNYEKLEIDYQAQYFSFSELPEQEYRYNERDVRLMLLAVLKECSRWKFITEVKNIPLTNTGLTRKNNQFINTAADRRAYGGMCSYQRRYTVDYVKFLERTFQGGYTHANAYYVSRPLNNVASFDIVSSYIDTILHRNYPHFFKRYNGKYKLGFFKHLSSFNTNDYEYCIEHYREPFKISFMATITIKNVKAVPYNKNLILPISISKCEQAQGVTLDNGRIYKAYLLKLNVTEVDYFIIKQFYNFNVVECSELYYTNFHKPLADFVLNSTREYLHEKSTLKKILAKAERGQTLEIDDFYNEAKGDYIFAAPECNNIINLPEEERKIILTDYYRLSKNKLNAQYGINVQKLISPVIEYDIVNDYFNNELENGVTARVLYRDFVKGLYITAYSRLNLFCYGIYLSHYSNTRLVYSDTDSWKVHGDIKKAKEVNKKYNEKIEKIVNNSVDYNIGYFDFECSYTDFCTLGCKKYIVSDGKKITVTIAGVNKYKTSAAYTELFKSLNYDFKLLCEVAFNPCTILSDSITDKVITKYNTGEYELPVTDENGKQGIIKGYNMVELVKSDYVLMDFDKPVINEYIDYFSTLQNKSIDIIPTYIYNENGRVKYKYISDWSESLKILRGEDVNFLNIVNGGQI